MQEVVGQALTYLRGLWRFRWSAMAFAWLLALVAWAYAYQVPDQFKASARVHVDTQSKLKPLLRGLVVDSNTDRQVEFMTRTLLARPNLEKIARASDLDLRAQGPKEMENILDRLEQGIQLSSAGRSNLYSVSYTDSDPRQAKSVVQAVVTLFVEESLGKTRQDTENAQAFLDRKVQEYKARLERAENRLMEFKRKHTGEMPGEKGDYYDRLQKKMAKLEDARFQLQLAQERKRELESQLEKENPTLRTVDSEQNADGGSQTPELDKRISNLQGRLDQLLLKYTPKHPEVVSLKQTLQELEKRRSEVRRELAQQGTEDAPSEGGQNPVYQQIRASLASVRADIAEAKEKVKQYKKQTRRLKNKVDTIPKVEAKLAQLNRDYQTTKNTYQQLLERQQSAQISEEAESSSKQVKFKVIEPPRVPSEPAAPNRPLLVTAGFGGSVVGGAGLALFLSLLWPTFYNRSALYASTGVPVLGAIHRVTTPGSRRRGWLELMAYGGAAAALAAAFGAAMVFTAKRGAILATVQRVLEQMPGAGGG